jgi:hypothetical protein
MNYALDDFVTVVTRLFVKGGTNAPERPGHAGPVRLSR